MHLQETTLRHGQSLVGQNDVKEEKGLLSGFPLKDMIIGLSGPLRHSIYAPHAPSVLEPGGAKWPYLFSAMTRIVVRERHFAQRSSSILSDSSEGA